MINGKDSLSPCDYDEFVVASQSYAGSIFLYLYLYKRQRSRRSNVIHVHIYDTRQEDGTSVTLAASKAAITTGLFPNDDEKMGHNVNSYNLGTK